METVSKDLGPPADAASHAFVRLGSLLRAAGYEFVTPTPETHRRVWERARRAGSLLRAAPDPRDVLGWNFPFRAGTLGGELEDALKDTGAIESWSEPGAQAYRSRIRFSTLRTRIYLHSAYPTEAEDAVFFGPDTYRFCRFLEHVGVRGGRLADIGAGAGAGGLSVAATCDEVILTDRNPRAIGFCRVNAELAGWRVGEHSPRIRFNVGSGLDGVAGELDWIIANPPYLVDRSERAYRHGGRGVGSEISLRWAEEGAARLAPGGRFVLYTGTAIQSGRDPVWEGLRALADLRGLELDYAEIDPDVFGEELENEAYAMVDRIAAVGAVLRRS